MRNSCPLSLPTYGEKYSFILLREKKIEKEKRERKIKYIEIIIRREHTLTGKIKSKKDKVLVLQYETNHWFEERAKKVRERRVREKKESNREREREIQIIK